MALIDQKKKVFGNIAAMRTLNDGFPKLKTNSSFPSINNNGNSLEFLTDLLKSLVGYEKLRSIVTNILVHNLDIIEQDIKKALKSELKSIVNCGVDPSIPTFLKFGSTGINTKVKDIDFFDTLLIDPTTLGGGLIYDDVVNQLTSTDFNTYLYYTIQNDGVSQNWGSTTFGNDILNITFNSIGIGTNPNNSLTITASQYYSLPVNNKTLTDLNNDYIDSLKLFGTEKIINNIIDSLFGSVSIKINKTTSQLENEEKITSITDCIINSDENAVIDDNYFIFSNDEIRDQQERADDRKKGIRKLKTCGNMEVSIPTGFLIELQSGLTATTNVTQVNDVVSSSINDMANFTSSYTSVKQDKYSVQLNFIQEILNKLMNAIVNIILGPKIITIFLINYKILYGPTATYDDAVDFLKNNKTLIKDMMNRVRNNVIQTLMTAALKEISTLVGETAIKIQTEKAKLQLSRLLSLVGVPQSVIRIIQGLT